MNAEKRLKDLNIILPKSSAPAGSYSKVVILDGMAHLSGQGPETLMAQQSLAKYPQSVALKMLSRPHVMLAYILYLR